MINPIYLIFLFVPLGSGVPSTDWSVEPSMNHAIKITKAWLNQKVPQKHIIFITLDGYDLDLDPFFCELPSTITVSVVSWDFLIVLAKYLESENQAHLIVMIMDPELEKADIGEFYVNIFGFRRSCKIIAILPDVVELNQTFVQSEIASSFLLKHSIVFLYSDYAMLYKDDTDHLTNVTDKVLESGQIFEVKKTLDGDVLVVIQMDDPPRSKVVDGRVTGVDGLFLDGYAQFLNTSYELRDHFDQRLVYQQLLEWYSKYDVLIFNEFDFVYPVTEYTSMFYMFKFTHKCLLVPKQPPINFLEQFRRIIQPSLVMLFLVMFVVIGLVIYLVLSLRPKLKIGLCDIYFTLFQIAITNSVPRSKMRTLFERVSLFACIVVCFLIVSGVQSLLQRYLVFPVSEEIDTVDQLNQSNLNILAKLNSKHLLEENFGAAFASKVVVVDNPANEKINQSFAYMMNKDEVDRFYLSSANFVDGVQQMHRMEECLEKQYQGYIGTIDSYYEESMHFYLQAIEESGIRHYWEQEKSNEEYLKRGIFGEEGTITFVHIKKMLKLLFIGYVAATLAFLVEFGVWCVKQFQQLSELKQKLEQVEKLLAGIKEEKDKLTALAQQISKAKALIDQYTEHITVCDKMSANEMEVIEIEEDIAETSTGAENSKDHKGRP